MDFPIQNCGSFHSYVKLPEGNHLWKIHIPMKFPWKIHIPMEIPLKIIFLWKIHHYGSMDPSISSSPSGSKEKTLNAHEATVSSIAASPQGAPYDPRLVSCSKVWIQWGVPHHLEKLEKWHETMGKYISWDVFCRFFRIEITMDYHGIS